MPKYLITALLLIVVAIPAVTQAQAPSCPELLRNESDLDKVYNMSKLVFIARIRPRNKINPHIYNFNRYEPVLKGKVPEQGFITFADNCAPRTDDTIYLFMLNRLDEKIGGYNAVFFSLPDGGPGFRWIADWIATKIPKQKATEEGK